MKRALAVSAGVTILWAAAAVTPSASPGWSYDHPRKWVDDFPKCGGVRQSPIRVRAGMADGTPRAPLVFQYLKDTKFTVSNNSHTIVVGEPRKSNTVLMDGRLFELLQFHFHSPSEEVVDGTRGAMVAHLVHQDKVGTLLVVAVLLDEGDDNAIIDDVWDEDLTETSTAIDVRLNPEDLLPADRSFYHYKGSLTTPPCSQGVLWFYLQNRGQVSADQVAFFTDIFPKSVRPLQPRNGRRIRFSNS